MESFVRRENIKRYRKLLREVQDEATRRRILKLLAEAEKGKHIAGQAPANLADRWESDGRPGRSQPSAEEAD